LQNYIIFLLLYQKSIIISDITTNPPAAIIADRARGGRGRGRSNYRSRGRGCSRFRNRTYRGGSRERGNSRGKGGRRDYSGSS
jgi:hypothetical protein